MSLIFFSLVLVVVFWLYKRFNSQDEFSLEAQKIPHEKGYPIIGNLVPLVTLKEGGGQFIDRYYKNFINEKLFGFYGFGNDAIILKDPSYIKQALIKDSDHFVNRERNEDNLAIDKLLGRSLLMLRDQKWRDMRTMLSPVYTSSKMKYMYELLIECMEEFSTLYKTKAEANGGKHEIETHDVFARITADGIATTALGFKGDCVKNQDSKIYEIADAMETDFTNPASIIIANVFPWFWKLFGMQLFRKNVHEFFETNVLGEIKRRTEGKIKRPDVIQLLVQAKEGQLNIDSADTDEISYTELKSKKITNWSDQELAAQAMVFFLGGFETTATLMQAMSFELARNPEIQQTLFQEVDAILEKLDGKAISYDQLNQLKFLDMVAQETLRKWPSFRATARHCNKDYVLRDEESGQTYTIKKGVDIIIPFGSIQMDPKYFPNPEKFDPYRFSDENKSKIVSGTFLPFGMGPRICIGSRYALLEAKLLLFYIMTNFSIEKSSRTPEKLTHSKGQTGYMEKIYVTLKLRK